MIRRFMQIDVFGSRPLLGNPLAVVLDAEGLTAKQMADFSAWTNLSECTFVLPPTTPDADYRVRIFSLTTELPFAGHPTLGTARAWLESGGVPRTPGRIVQECGVGPVQIRHDAGSSPAEVLLSFAAPPMLRTGAIEPERLATALGVLGVSPDEVVDSAWIDNGPGWMGILLRSAARVRDVPLPDASLEGQWSIGLVGPHPHGAAVAVEVRAFFNDSGGSLREDPVTGSLNASVAQWLTGTDASAHVGMPSHVVGEDHPHVRVPLLTAPYVATQGGALGRDGRIHVDAEAGRLWIGGRTDVLVSGTVAL